MHCWGGGGGGGRYIHCQKDLCKMDASVLYILHFPVFVGEAVGTVLELAWMMTTFVLSQFFFLCVRIYFILFPPVNFVAITEVMPEPENITPGACEWYGRSHVNAAAASAAFPTAVAVAFVAIECPIQHTLSIARTTSSRLLYMILIMLCMPVGFLDSAARKWQSTRAQSIKSSPGGDRLKSTMSPRESVCHPCFEMTHLCCREKKNAVQPICSCQMLPMMQSVFYCDNCDVESEWIGFGRSVDCIVLDQSTTDQPLLGNRGDF